MSTEIPNKGGRPPGSVEDPNTVSRRQVLSDAKLYKEMAEDLKRWYSEHKDTLSLEDRLKCLNFLREAVLQGLKFHLAPAKADSKKDEPGEAFSAEVVYQELIGRSE